MDEELYKQELWASIDKTAVNLHYLDFFRDKKMGIEPVYRGLLGMVAVIAAIVSFFDVSVLTKTVSVVTAVLATLPLFFPVLPKSSDFGKMSKLRGEVYGWLVKLEEFWCGEWTDEKYREYLRMKTAFGEVENELSSVFGTIDAGLEKKSQEVAYRYLDKNHHIYHISS